MVQYAELKIYHLFLKKQFRIDQHNYLKVL